MKTKILKQEKNPFLGREEILMEIESKSAPNTNEVKKAVGKDENLIVVNKITNNFGRKIFVADIFVYESAEAKGKVEVIPKKIRKKMEEEEKKAEEEAKKAVAVEAEAKKANEVNEAQNGVAQEDKEKKDGD